MTPDDKRFDLMVRLRDVEDDLRQFTTNTVWIQEKLEKLRTDIDDFIKEVIYSVD